MLRSDWQSLEEVFRTLSVHIGSLDAADQICNSFCMGDTRRTCAHYVCDVGLLVGCTHLVGLGIAHTSAIFDATGDSDFCT